MSRRIRLSGVIVAQDNESTLAPVLAQLGRLCGEIVVVDGGSEDGTVELALRHPKVRLYHRRFEGNLAEQKNFALDQALGEWILLLDSDELLCREAERRLPGLLRNPLCSWFKFARLWLLPDASGEEQFLDSRLHHPDWQLRLFRNRPPFRYDLGRSPIHHNFPKAGRGRGRKLARCHIAHFDFRLNDRARREAKVERYRAMDAASEDTHRMYLYEDWEEARPARVPETARGLRLDGSDDQSSA